MHFLLHLLVKPVTSTAPGLTTHCVLISYHINTQASAMSNIFNLQRGADDVVDYLNFDYSPPENSKSAKNGQNSADKESKSSSKRRSHSPTDEQVSRAIQESRARRLGREPHEVTAAPQHDGGEEVIELDMRNGKKKIPLKSVQEHQLLMNQITAYFTSERFRPILVRCGIRAKDLQAMTIAELKEYRERIRACCANGGSSGGVIAAMTLTACGALERLAPKRMMDLDGYKDAVAMNPEFEALCEMIEIDSGFKTSMSPMQKMALCLGTTALSVAHQNKQRNAANGGGQAPPAQQNPLLASLIAELL